MIENIEMERFADISRYAGRYCSCRDTYSYASLDIDTDSDLYDRLLAMVMNFDGVTILLCTRGAMRLEVNLETADVRADTVIVLGSRTIVRYVPGYVAEDCHLEVLFMSTAFMRNINIDLNSINTRFIPPRTPVMALQPDETAQLQLSLEMLYRHTVSNNHDDRYFGIISRSITASMMYQMMQFGDRRMNETPVTTEHTKSRRVTYVQNFISLVYEHHTRERSVSFYAGKLCISPKYLSMIIKEATGRSASDIIDDFVITEAKNLLRYSDKNIQQIAYHLNFSNQSSFGKYFKHVTGMSPTKFQSR